MTRHTVGDFSKQYLTAGNQNYTIKVLPDSVPCEGSNPGLSVVPSDCVFPGRKVEEAALVSLLT